MGADDPTQLTALLRRVVGRVPCSPCHERHDILSREGELAKGRRASKRFLDLPETATAR